jgi:hypothetical protein
MDLFWNRDTSFCNWLQFLKLYFLFEVFRCRMLILIETEFFLRIQIFNQKMQKSLDFGTELSNYVSSIHWSSVKEKSLSIALIFIKFVKLFIKCKTGI